MSERRNKELANIEKLEVAGITLQEARAQTTEIVYARWLDDVAKETPEDSGAVRSSEDATQVMRLTVRKECRRQHQSKRPGLHRACMVATEAIEKEQHHSTSVVWRNVTAWYRKHETDKCWRGIKNILMGELVIGIPMIFVLKDHGCMVVHRGINFPYTFRHKDHATNQTDVVRWRDDGKTHFIQRSEMDPTGIRTEVKQQTC